MRTLILVLFLGIPYTADYMYIIRPVRHSDINALEKCALAAGLGMTHLPRRRDVLESLITLSVDSFNKNVTEPIEEHYLFVLEDTTTHTVAGTSAIYSKTGTSNPFYAYQIEMAVRCNERLPELEDPRMLRLFPYYHGPSEIAALFLFPEYRHSGLGKLLSLSRFLFMASHLYRFDKVTIANMRGIIKENVSPFWDGLGRHFLNVELNEVMAMRLENNNLISEILPPHPIYATLLPPDVQAVIGKVHPNTEPALHLLYKENFHFNNEIDPVDGGPILAAETSEIFTVRESKVAQVAEISDKHSFSHNQILVSNLDIDFRACFASIEINPNHTAILANETASALNVKPGDSIRYRVLEGGK